MENIKYEDFFINRKNIPPKGTDARKAFRKQEIDRCLGGVYVDGVFISGWLYWHMNFWWISDDIKDEHGNIIPFETVASLRDNEWIRAEALEKCRTHPDGLKGYIEVGLRQGGKSTIESSFTAYNATLFKKSQNAVVSGSEDDLNNIKLRLNYGLSKLWDGMKKPKLTKDKRAKEITLGYKATDGEDIIWSHIIIRNIAEGQNTEGPAGLSAKSFIMDEIGKSRFSQALEAAKPALMSKYGWRAIPILVGTGGSFEKGEDAERIFYHPEANNFLSFINADTGEKTGLFMSGLFRTDCKYKTNLADYLISEGKIPQGEYPELVKIPILVSDKKKALEKIKEERRLKAQDPDQTDYLKLIMYFPLTPKECFLSSSENFYNTEIAQNQKDELERKYPGLKIGMWVELEEYQDNTIHGPINIEDVKIRHKPSTKTPITSFPCLHENTNTPIVILEHPTITPWGLYVAGVDPYRFEKAPNSDSLGAVYIFKRMYDVQSDSFQDMFVAWYVGRPDSKENWNNNARLLIKYYNAVTLCENDEMSFIDYMIAKGDGHYLMDTPDWLKEFIPNSSTLTRAKGISSAAPKVKELLRTTQKQYFEEVFTTIPIAGSTETKKLLGVTKVYDPMLLSEIIKWNKDGNFDREIAASLAITCARKLDAQKMKVLVETEDPRYLPPENYGKNIVSRRSTFKPLGHTPSDSRILKLFK